MYLKVELELKIHPHSNDCFSFKLNKNNTYSQLSISFPKTDID